MADVSVEELNRFSEGVPIGIFSQLSAEHLSKISDITSRRRFEVDEMLIEDGDEGDEMFLLLSGQVRVTKKLFIKTAKRVGEGEKEIVVLPAEWNPYFGELALFDPQSIRTATIRGVESGELGVIQNKDFVALSEADHDVGFFVLSNILQKQVGVIRKSNENILNLTTALSFALTQ